VHPQLCRTAHFFADRRRATVRRIITSYFSATSFSKQKWKYHVGAWCLIVIFRQAAPGIGRDRCPSRSWRLLPRGESQRRAISTSSLLPCLIVSGDGASRECDNTEKTRRNGPKLNRVIVPPEASQSCKLAFPLASDTPRRRQSSTNSSRDQRWFVYILSPRSPGTRFCPS